MEFMVVRENKRKPMHEIEYRFLTKDRNKIEQRLLIRGAKVIYQGHVVDHWFVPKEIKSLAEKNEWFDSGRGFGVRIREQDNSYTGKVQTSLEVKRLVTPYEHNTCIETEVTGGDFQSLSSLLNLMNLKKFAVLEKDRLVYRLEGLNIVIDDIKDFKVVVEIECVSNRPRGSVLAELKHMAFKLGLSLPEDLIKTSPTFLYMEKFSKF
mgnify:FL=1